MKLKETFLVLKKYHGSHSSAALALGITPEHYRALRNGRVNIPQRTADYILLKAQEALPKLPTPSDSPETETSALSS